MRTVHCADALDWLAHNPLPDDAAVLTSLPNFDELSHRDVARWRTWFVDAAQAVLAHTPRANAAVFFQTDVKHAGTWIDKAYLVQLAAERTGARLLWHKLALRAPVGTTTNARPGYAHLLCFTHADRDAADGAAPDVLPALGAMTWPRAIGLDVARFAVHWLRDHVGAGTIVDPFCGVGTVLAVAEQAGLDAVGIERNPGRADRARQLCVRDAAPSPARRKP